MKLRIFLAMILVIAARAEADSKWTTSVLPWPQKLHYLFSSLPGTTPIGPTLADGFAMSDDGVLCTFDVAKSDAILFPKLGSDQTLDGEIRAQIEGQPQAVVFKKVGDKSYFLIGSGSSSRISVIDAHTGRALPQIQTAAARVDCLAAAADAGVPYVYYSGRGGRGFAEIGRIDLAQMIDNGLIEMTRPKFSAIAASHDGKILYAWYRDEYPHDCVAMAIDETNEKLRVKPFDASRAEDAIIASPTSDRVASGRGFLSANLQERRELLDQPVAFSTRRTLVFALVVDNSISVISPTNGSRLARVPNPLTAGRSPGTTEPSTKRSSNGRSSNVTMFFDDVHGKLIVLNLAYGVAVMPIDELQIKNEVAVHADVAGDTTLTIGQPWKATVYRSDPSVAMKLLDAPPTLTLEGDELRWTPKDSDIGEHQFTLSLAAGEVSTTKSVKLLVRRESFGLPFSPDLISISADGERAVVVQTAGEHKPDTVRRDDSDTSSRIVLIDLEHRKILADRTLLVPLKVVSVDEHFVYASLRDSSALRVLSLTDLSDVKRIFTPTTIYRLGIVGPRLYTGLTGKPGLQWYALPDLTLDPTEPPRDAPIQNIEFPLEVDGGWYVHGAVYDRTLSHVRRIILDDFFATFRPPSRAIDEYNNEKPAGPWNFQVQEMNVRRTGGQNVLHIPDIVSSESYIVPEVPVVVALNQHQEKPKGSQDYNMVTEIEAYPLATCDRLPPIVLMAEPPRPGGRLTPSHLAVSKTRMIAQVYDQLYIIPTSDLPKDKLAKPFDVTPPDGTIAIPGDRPTTIALRVTGAKGDVVFALTQETPDVQIDEKTGALTIDPQPLLGSVNECLMRTAQAHFSGSPAPGMATRSPAEALAAYRKAAANRFKELTGALPKGDPVALPMTIIAHSSEQQTIRFDYTVLIDALPPARSATTTTATTQPTGGN